MAARSFIALSLVALLAGASGAAPAAAAQTADDSPIRRIAECRAITADAARLACYDQAVGAVQTAQASGDIVILDRAAVDESRRRAFGFDINIVNPFNREGGPEELREVETRLTSVRRIGAGKMLFALEDGSSWLQIDDTAPYFRERAGVPVRIRRAALGSYLLSVDGARSIRVKRQ
jgi:hypothetical protein